MSKKTEPKRLLVLGDLHAGSWCGLTPPQWDGNEGTTKASKSRYKFRRELWDWYSKTLKKIGPVDAALINGDLVDGSGRRSGGSETIIPLQEQGECAVYACNLIQTTDYYLSYGTGYHTGDEVDAEYFCAQRLGGSIEDRQFLRVHGNVIRATHHAGGSSIPHGQHTFPSRVAIGNKLKALEGEEPEADILFFSHRHTFSYEGDATRFSMRLPCLQGPMSKFGRRCEGPYTMGVVLFEFSPPAAKGEKGVFSWTLHQAKLRTHLPSLQRI